MKERSATIDVLRAMAIGLVVLGHALIFCRHLNGLMEAIYSFHMPLMFSISGYVTAMSWKGGAWRKIGRTAFRLLVPYAVFALFFIPIANAATVGNAQVAFADAWHKALVLNRSLWFLPCCFILVVVFVATRKLNELFHHSSLLTRTSTSSTIHNSSFLILTSSFLSWLLALSPIAVCYFLFPQIDYFRSVLYYAFSFIAGTWLYAFVSSRYTSLDAALERARAYPVRLCLCTAVFLALVIIYAAFHLTPLKPLVGLFSLLPLALLSRRLASRPRLSRLLSFIGQSTLVIYCLDFIATPRTIWHLHRLTLQGLLPVPVLITITFLYVPLAISIFCFLRLMYLENVKPTSLGTSHIAISDEKGIMR